MKRMKLMKKGIINGVVYNRFNENKSEDGLKLYISICIFLENLFYIGSI